MNTALTDSNLHYAVVAWQMNLIDQDQFAEVMNQWAADKSRPLDELLPELGMLNAEDQALLAQLVARQLEMHDGDATQCLASTSNTADLQDTMSLISDPDVESSLAEIAEQTMQFRPSAKTRGFGKQAVDSPGDAADGGSRFRILRPHAKGGLGQVYVARDEEIGREVALKEIQPEYAGNDSLRDRFVLEAEINGNLEHPGIVPVYGLGAFDDGRPYYAMRFIEGDSLKEAIEEFHKDADTLDATAYNFRLRQLLGRFIDVCDAMAYAHSRGVLHRDLKPANIMLGQYGETLIIDWGLAKAANRTARDINENESAETTLLPQSGSRVQASMDGRSVGTPAFMSPEQAAGNLAALGPATDIYGLGATLFALLTGKPPVKGNTLSEVIDRVVDGELATPREISSRVPPSLESICLKALALNPRDRYGSARDLADDIEHFLADEPVTARRDPFMTRVWRWVRKHRTLTTTAAATLLVGVVALGIGWTREARFSEQLANTNEQLRESNEATKQAEQLADQRLDLAMDSIRGYFTGVSEEALRGGQISDDLRDDLLTKPREFYEQLTADLAGKESPSERELGLLANGQFNLGNLLRLLGQNSEAVEQTRAAIASYDRLKSLDPQQDNYQRGTAESHNQLGVLLQTTGQFTDAIDAYQLAIRSSEALIERNPEAAEDLNSLARSLTNYGYLLHVTGKSTDAIPVYERAIELREQLIESYPDDTIYRRKLCTSLTNLGAALSRTGKLTESDAVLSRAVSNFEWLIEHEPDDPDHPDGLVACLTNRGSVFGSMGKLDEAAEIQQQAIEIGNSLVERFPNIPDYRLGVAKNLVNYSVTLRQQRDSESAIEAIDQAVPHYEVLIEQHPDVPQYQDGMALAIFNKGLSLASLKRTDEAIAEYQQATQLYKKLVEQYPESTEYRFRQTRVYSGIGNLHQTDGDGDEAVAAYEKAMANYEALIELQPNRPSFGVMLGATLNNIGLVYRREANYEEAAESFREAITVQKKALEVAPQDSDARRFLSIHYQNLSQELRRFGEPHEAAAVTRKQIELWNGTDNADELYNCTCWLSLCLPLLPEDTTDEDRETLAAEAVATLQKAIDAGWTNVGKISRDNDLNPIRDREDFKQIVDKLEDEQASP